MVPRTRSHQGSSSNETTQENLGGSSSNKPTSEPTHDPGTQHIQKKVRGPTGMKNIWGQEEGVRLPVMFDDATPYRENKSSFVEFLGTITRNGNYAPVNYKDWRLLPAFSKTNMIELVNRKFDIPDGKSVYILESIGHKWRNWKGKIKECHYNSSLSVEAQMHNIPPRVKDDQWKGLLEIFNSKDMKKQELGRSPSRKELFTNVYFRKNKDGTESASEAEKEALEKMRKLAEEAPEDYVDNVGKNDMYAQVMGKEKNGHRHMYGIGVCPSDIFGPILSASTSYMKMQEMQTQGDAMKELHTTLYNEVQELRSIIQSEIQKNNSSVSEDIRGQSLTQPENNTSQASSHRSVKVRSLVTLRSIMNRDGIVAKGIVSSMDPLKKVGGVELGMNWCGVNVQIAVKWEESLIRPYEIIQIIGDAVGAPIAWPLSLVVLDEENVEVSSTSSVYRRMFHFH